MLSFEREKPTKYSSQKECSRQPLLDDLSNTTQSIAAYASPVFLSESKQRPQRSREYPVAQMTQQQQQQQTGTYSTTYLKGVSNEIPPGPLCYERDIERLSTNEFSPPIAAQIRRGAGRYRSQRQPGNHDEFNGPVQLLERPASDGAETLESDLLQISTNLNTQEQDEILRDVNKWLPRCAFNFIAKYQFPIPIEPDRTQVRDPTDRDWTEWAYLLKRLATKRRIPARVLYNGQIKQFVVVLENSLEVRHTHDQPRPLKDDRNILQVISAATQVAKIVKDVPVMKHFNRLYELVESLILKRREQQRWSN